MTGLHTLRSIPAETLPAMAGGCDWGRPRLLIVRAGDKVVFLRPGYMTWSGVGSRRYAGSAIIAHSSREGFGGVTRYLAEGGRLSRKRLYEIQGKIDAFFQLRSGDQTIGDMLAFQWVSGLSFIWE